MWMEEHIGKRINHERVDEALATGATTVATACPFCRVMITDGVNDRQDRREAGGREGVDVRDVAQLLLESLDRSKIELPAKGSAAKQAAETAPTAAAVTTTEAPATATAQSEAAAPGQEKAAKAVTGLGIAGGAKRPGTKKPAPKAPQAETAQTPSTSDEQAPQPKTPAAPVKGLGIAGGAKRPGAKKPAPKAPQAQAAQTPSKAIEEPESKPEVADKDGAGKAPKPPAKGLGIARGARQPGKR
jgi:hypothetical protein